MSSKKDKIQLFSFLIEEIDKKIVSGTIENDYASILEDGRAVGISSYTTNLLVKTAVRNSDKFLELETPILPESCIYTHLSKKETSKISELEKELSELRKSPIIKKQKGRTFFIVTTVILLFLLVLLNTKSSNSGKNPNVAIIKKDTMAIMELDSTQFEKNNNEITSLQQEIVVLNQRIEELTSFSDSNADSLNVELNHKVVVTEKDTMAIMELDSTQYENNKITSLQNEIVVLKQRIEELTSFSNSKSNENDSLKALIHSKTEEINRLKSELKKIKNENTELNKKIKEYMDLYLFN